MRERQWGCATELLCAPESDPLLASKGKNTNQMETNLVCVPPSRLTLEKSKVEPHICFFINGGENANITVCTKLVTVDNSSPELACFIYYMLLPPMARIYYSHL